MSDGTNTVSFTYDAKGIRTSKVAGGATTNYIYADGKLLRETTGSETITYIYGLEGVVGFNYSNQTYLYKKNLFGDVIAIYDQTGTVVAEYSYTAFGECNILTNVNDIANKNPIRYRSYYYDEELNLYYLKSRYYDPEIGRFISIDSIEYIDPQTINGLNLYAYCGNNPVMYTDPNGTFILTSFLIGLGISALVGVTVSATAYTISEVVSYVITGEWNWSWGMFAGAALGGAIGGALSFVVPSLGITGSAFITGFLSSSIGMGLQNAFGEANYYLSEIFSVSILSGGASALTAGIMSKIKIPGITGRGSIGQVAKQMQTKLYNGSIRKLTLKSYNKILAYESFYSILDTVTSIINNMIKFYRNS